jgi:hypothetical protein
MRARQKYVNFFVTTIAPGSAIFAAQTAGTFEILNKTVDGYVLADGSYEWWAILDYGSITQREVFRITNVAGKILTWDKRVSPNGALNHAAGSSVQLNDAAEILNYLAQNVDDFGSCEVTSGLSVKVRGGQWTHLLAIPDVTLTLPNASSGWIVWNGATKAFSTVTALAEPNDYVAMASFVTAGGAVTALTDLRAPDTTLKKTGTGLKFLNDMGVYADPVVAPPGSLIAGIDSMTATTYDDEGLLTGFTADGVAYTVVYVDGEVSTITNGVNTWSASYDDEGALTGLVKT